MKCPFVVRTSLFLLTALINHTTLAQPTLMAPSEVFQASEKPATQKEPTRRVITNSPFSGRNNRPMNLTLGAPDADELQKLAQPNGRRKAYQIGISRSIPALPPIKDWVWSSVTGGQVGQFTITSEQASRVRLQLRITTNLPDGVDILIYDPANTETVHGPYTQQDFTTDENDPSTQVLWTPSLSGDSLGIEIFAPDNVNPNTIRVDFPVLSHIIHDLKSDQLDPSSTRGFNACDVSLACAPSEWQPMGKAVARYIYTGVDGNSYLCSGTLLSDLDSGSQIPYFLTAAHCVYDTTTANSMDFFWFYRESSCGADDATWTQTTGGADLLAAQATLDSALVRLKNAPPYGATMSGWVLDPLQNDTIVKGIHHGWGNPKQFSEGSFQSYISITSVDGGYITEPDDQGDFAKIQWSWGVTAPGSSGSGLWRVIDNQQLLTGTLVGGSSSCTSPESPDEYSRLDRFYPYIGEWLGQPSMQSLLNDQNKLDALTDGVLITRYMEGIRGEQLLDGITTKVIDITALEADLQNRVTSFDIDDDSTIEADTDGLLLTRYLIGLRDNALISGINLNGANNNTAESITAYLHTLLNQ